MEHEKFYEAMQDAISELSSTAHEKILETLKDTTQEITTKAWVNLLGTPKGLESPKGKVTACGCLMMDGYLKEHPPELKWDSYQELWKIPVELSEQLDVLLVPYYNMQDDDFAGDKITRVASTFDDWARQGTEDDNYVVTHFYTRTLKSGVRVLNKKGRKILTDMLEGMVR